MRKTVFALLTVVVFATVLAACATGPSRPSTTDETSISAARLVREGLLYEDRAQQFIRESNSWVPTQRRPAVSYATAGESRSRSSAPSYAEPSIPEGKPSENDIDSAIERYQAALMLQPSGTWYYDYNARSSSWYSSWMAAPEKNVKVLLEEAMKTKQLIAEKLAPATL